MSAGHTRLELGKKLHRALAVALIANLKDSPSAEMLSVARAFLAGNGIAVDVLDEADTKRVKRMWRLYLEALDRQLMSENPSGAVLSEVGRFMHRTGISHNAVDRVEASQRLRQMADLSDLPFQ